MSGLTAEGLRLVANSLRLNPSRSPWPSLKVVTIITTAGGCDPAYRYVVHVADGNVSPEVDQSSGAFDISGKVDGGGQVKVRVQVLERPQAVAV